MVLASRHPLVLKELGWRKRPYSLFERLIQESPRPCREILIMRLSFKTVLARTQHDAMPAVRGNRAYLLKH